MQRSALCRSLRELSNEYLLDEIGVDTAENELLQIVFNIIQYYSIVSLVINSLQLSKEGSNVFLGHTPYLRKNASAAVNKHVHTTEQRNLILNL